MLFGCSSSLSGLLPSRLNPLAGRSFGPLAARESEATTIAGQSFSRSRQHAPTTQAGQNSRLPCFRSPRHGRPALCGWPLRAMMVVASALARRLKKTRADGWYFYLRIFLYVAAPNQQWLFVPCVCWDRLFSLDALALDAGWMDGRHARRDNPPALPLSCQLLCAMSHPDGSLRASRRWRECQGKTPPHRLRKGHPRCQYSRCYVARRCQTTESVGYGGFACA